MTGQDWLTIEERRQIESYQRQAAASADERIKELLGVEARIRAASVAGGEGPSRHDITRAIRLRLEIETARRVAEAAQAVAEDLAEERRTLERQTIEREALENGE